MRLSKALFYTVLFFTTVPVHLFSYSLNISFDQEPVFSTPGSQLATQGQFYDVDFQRWSDELKEPVRFHRKLWELCYVAQTLNQGGYLKPGAKGLVFAVGTEPLPALFAKYGCKILATDQDLASAEKSGWVTTGQYTKDKAALNSRGICDPKQFDRLVELRCVDMNHIPKDLDEQFDFVWSCCSFEHLGSIQAGMEFVKNSIKCLKPGGIAVHTTEFNLSSLTKTITNGPTVIYRRGDIIDLAIDLIEQGYEVYPLNFNRGSGELDVHVDCPPYTHDHHIKLQLASFVTTSIGLIIRKPLK